MKNTNRNILMFAWPILLAGLIFLIYQFGAKGDNSAGAKIYKSHCANCHGDSGEGLRSLYPPLAGADYLKDHEADLACIIRNGVDVDLIINGKTYNQPMPGNQLLSDQEIAILIDHIRNSWGNDYGNVPFSKVKNALDLCAPTSKSGK
ncbi:MAG: cytochrome c [Bacteroidia bacterium]|nr:cytochrome c [Bacteroidia bacterium]